jgi:uncharacterized protein YjdB
MSATEPTKGAGTSFWRLKSNETLDPATLDDFTADAKWEQLAKVRDITPGEMTAEDEEDNYLDDENADWSKTSPGTKSGGDVSLTLAWLPGETAQQQLVTDFNNDVVTYYKIKYPNGTLDVFFGYINSLGKAVAIKDKMTRTIKIKTVGKPKTAEEILIAVDAANSGG